MWSEGGTRERVKGSPMSKGLFFVVMYMFTENVILVRHEKANGKPSQNSHFLGKL